jgi:hypothetical protein
MSTVWPTAGAATPDCRTSVSRCSSIVSTPRRALAGSRTVVFFLDERVAAGDHERP